MRTVLVAGAICLLSVVPRAAHAAAPQATVPASVQTAAEAFRAKIALNPILLRADPYETYAATPLPGAEPGTLCALRYEHDRIRYRLETFPSTRAAAAAGFIVTHGGRCGTCSTLQDLAVYLSVPDMMSPVRACAMRGITRGRTLACLEDLGLSPACAATWYYSSRNTRRSCMGICLKSWLSGEPPVGADGTMNACMQCGERASGAVFQYVAGRTRRSSGIRSPVDRSTVELYQVVHDYY